MRYLQAKLALLPAVTLVHQALELEELPFVDMDWLRSVADDFKGRGMEVIPTT